VVKRQFEWLLDLEIGRWRPSVATAVARLGLGVLAPIPILAYAVTCMATGRALVISRGGLAMIYGYPAMAVGVAYACVAFLIYVHVCWEDHSYFAGLRDFARQLLLMAILIAMAATFGLVLL
jgi:hypothetical protein